MPPFAQHTHTSFRKSINTSASTNTAVLAIVRRNLTYSGPLASSAAVTGGTTPSIRPTHLNHGHIHIKLITGKVRNRNSKEYSRIIGVHHTAATHAHCQYCISSCEDLLRRPSQHVPVNGVVDLCTGKLWGCLCGLGAVPARITGCCRVSICIAFKFQVLQGTTTGAVTEKRSEDCVTCYLACGASPTHQRECMQRYTLSFQVVHDFGSGGFVPARHISAENSKANNERPNRHNFSTAPCGM